jgi:NADH-quinone oxidoreductase subunit C
MPRYLKGFICKPWGLWIFVKAYEIHLALFLLYYNSNYLAQYLVDLFALDFPSNKQHRFLVYYSLWLPFYSFRFFLVLPASTNSLVLSISSIFPSAAWFERENWDMFGLKFLLHKDLRRILTDYGFQGHPLRKDFPLVGFLEIRYDETSKSILLEPVELSQELRFFSFVNPWREWFLTNQDLRWDFTETKD